MDPFNYVDPFGDTPQGRYMIVGSKTIKVTAVDLFDKSGNLLAPIHKLIVLGNDFESETIPLKIRKRAREAILYLLNPANKYKGLPLAKEVFAYDNPDEETRDLFHFHLAFLTPKAMIAYPRINTDLKDDITSALGKLEKEYRNLQRYLNLSHNPLAPPEVEEYCKPFISKYRANIAHLTKDLDKLLGKVWKHYESANLALQFHTYEDHAMRPPLPDGSKMPGTYPGRHQRFPLKGGKPIFPVGKSELKDPLAYQGRYLYPGGLPGNNINFFFTRQKGVLYLHFRYGEF